jgi:predicted transposase/invertase (TIGR01784 family)
MYDKWLFVLHNLSRLMKRPEALQERIFTRLFEQAEIARYTPEERLDYEDSLKVYRDLKNVLDTAELKGMKKGLRQGIEQGLQQGIEQGRQQGIEQGRQEGIEKGIAQGALDEKRKNARTMKSLGLPLETIAKVTGLSVADIAEL